MVLSPLNVTLSHVNTIAKMKEVLQTVAGLDVPDSLVRVCTSRTFANDNPALVLDALLGFHVPPSASNLPTDSVDDGICCRSEYKIMNEPQPFSGRL